MRSLIRRKKLLDLRHFRQNHLVRNMGKEIAVLAYELGQHNPWILAHSVIDEGIIEYFLRRGRPTHKPPLISARHGIGMFGTKITRRIKGPIRDGHLQGITAPRCRAIHFKGIGDSDPRTPGISSGASC